jgi:hypothetical protein
VNCLETIEMHDHRFEGEGETEMLLHGYSENQRVFFCHIEDQHLLYN